MPLGSLLHTEWKAAVLSLVCHGDLKLSEQPCRNASSNLPTTSSSYVLHGLFLQCATFLLVHDTLNLAWISLVLQLCLGLGHWATSILVKDRKYISKGIAIRDSERPWLPGLVRELLVHMELCIHMDFHNCHPIGAFLSWSR